MRTRLGRLTIGVAVLAAVVPWPPQLTVVLADRVYPIVQSTLTAQSNTTPVPLAEACAVAALISWLLWTRRCWRSTPRRRGRWLVGTGLVVSLVYLWFLAVWGHHYRAPALDGRLSGFDAARVTPAAVRNLADQAGREANRLHGPAHAAGFPGVSERPEALVASWHRVERQMGRPRPSVPSRLKRPWTSPYLKAVGVSGLLAPFFLETYLNPDLTPPERPAVLAHEWAHLSGFAREEDASFVGVLAALGADVSSRYSAWLLLVSEVAAQLHPVTRTLVLERLGEGPRRDLQAVAERQRTRVAWLDRAAWGIYDRALRSQGATQGVDGYGRVVYLLVGSGRMAQVAAEVPVW